MKPYQRAYEQRKTEMNQFFSIPEHIESQFDDFVLRKEPAGEFVKALLCNDLKRSITYADRESRPKMKQIVQWLLNVLPYACQGSEEKYQTWLTEAESTLSDTIISEIVSKRANCG